MPAGPEHTYEVQAILSRLGCETGPVDGELNEATLEALCKFQADAGLEPIGEVTMLTVIELRNHWGKGRGDVWFGSNPIGRASLCSAEIKLEVLNARSRLMVE